MTLLNFSKADLSVNVDVVTDLIDYAGGQRRTTIMEVRGVPKDGGTVNKLFAAMRPPMQVDINDLKAFAVTNNLTLKAIPQNSTESPTVLNTES